MPVPPSHYPPGWRTFSQFIRFTRAGGRCECHGQCGLHTRYPNPLRCVEEHGKPAWYARGRVVLTTAHLCACHPICTIESHVIAACQRCHLRIDRFKHAKARRATQMARKAQTP